MQLSEVYLSFCFSVVQVFTSLHKLQNWRHRISYYTHCPAQTFIFTSISLQDFSLLQLSQNACNGSFSITITSSIIIYSNSCQFLPNTAVVNANHTCNNNTLFPYTHSTKYNLVSINRKTYHVPQCFNNHQHYLFNPHSKINMPC